MSSITQRLQTTTGECFRHFSRCQNRHPYVRKKIRHKIIPKSDIAFILPEYYVIYFYKLTTACNFFSNFESKLILTRFRWRNVFNTLHAFLTIVINVLGKCMPCILRPSNLFDILHLISLENYWKFEFKLHTSAKYVFIWPVLMWSLPLWIVVRPINTLVAFQRWNWQMSRDLTIYLHQEMTHFSWGSSNAGLRS